MKLALPRKLQGVALSTVASGVLLLTIQAQVIFTAPDAEVNGDERLLEEAAVGPTLQPTPSPAPAPQETTEPVLSPAPEVEPVGFQTTVPVREEFEVPPSRSMRRVAPVSQPPSLDELPPDVLQDMQQGPTALESVGDFLQRKPFLFSISVREGFDSNPNTSKNNREESFYTNLAGGINYGFGNPRLQLQTNLTAGLTFYYNNAISNNIRLNAVWDLSAVYNASPRLIFTLGSSFGYYSEPDVFIPGIQANVDGDYVTVGTTLTGTYQWLERFSTTTGYAFNMLAYVESELNDDLGRITQTISQAFNFLYKPTTSIVAEYRIQPTTYFKADLDTLNQFALIGFDQMFSPRMTWNARAGAQFNLLNHPVEGRGTYFGPYVETVYNYQYGERSRMNFNLRYGTEASGLSNVTQRQSFRAGYAIVHAFTPRLAANGGLFYNVNYYEQGDVIDKFYENIFELSLGLDYAFNRFLSATSGYKFTGVISRESPDREYNRNIVFLGLNASF